jgi:hypothetical protein
MEHEASAPFSRDLPPVVVQKHMVMATEQDAAVDVGLAVVFAPVVGVVGFAVRRGPVAAGPSASAVAHGEHDALSAAEEALLTPEIERIALSIEHELDTAALADVAIDDRTGESRAAVFGAPRRQHATERVSTADRVGGHDHPHARLSCAEHVGCRGERTRLEHVDEEVVRELVVRSRVLLERGSGLPLGGVDEARAPRRGRSAASFIA